MYISMKNIKSILFLLNALFIFASEMIIYSVFQDYYFFIDRLSMRLASINILYVKIFQAFALNNILIDDNHKKLEDWASAGGTSVFHNDSTDTIRVLEEIFTDLKD